MASELTPEQIRASIVPKSDQINADDLLSGPMTVTVAGVSAGSPEQPVNIRLVGEQRVYRPCKTMRRILVALWTDDGHKWIGRRMTLVHDPEVKFGGVKVGGIRISHMSDIAAPAAISVMLSKAGGQAKKGIHNVLPLPPAQQAAPQQPPDLSHEVLTFREQSWSRSSRGAQDWANAIGKAAAECTTAGDTAGARAIFTEYGPQLEDALTKLPANAAAARDAIAAALSTMEGLGNE